jgi:hypothetical protein
MGWLTHLTMNDDELRVLAIVGLAVAVVVFVGVLILMYWCFFYSDFHRTLRQGQPAEPRLPPGEPEPDTPAAAIRKLASRRILTSLRTRFEAALRRTPRPETVEEGCEEQVRFLQFEK